MSRTNPMYERQDADADPFEVAVERARIHLPMPFRRHLRDVVFQTPDFADDDTLFLMAIESPWDLLGLYQGIPVGEQSVALSGRPPDIIYLFREPIRAYAAQTGEALDAVVEHVLIHEIGHHFGLSDDDMDAIEAKAEQEEAARNEAKSAAPQGARRGALSWPARRSGARSPDRRG